MKLHEQEWTNGEWRIEFEGKNKGQPRNIPAGEWDNEPDKIQWVDSETDLDCLMVRNHFGNWCGYVGLAEGHPLYGLEYSFESPVLVALRDKMLQQPVPENPGFAVLISLLSGSFSATAECVFEVHGGITFSDFCREPTFEQWIEQPADARMSTFDEWFDREMKRRICHVPIPGRPGRVWWFGFDCAHSGDTSPGMLEWRKQFPALYNSETYRNRAYVEEQVTKLAQQLKAVQVAAAA